MGCDAARPDAFAPWVSVGTAAPAPTLLLRGCLETRVVDEGEEEEEEMEEEEVEEEDGVVMGGRVREEIAPRGSGRSLQAGGFVLSRDWREGRWCCGF